MITLLQVDATFMDKQKETISFLMYLPGSIGQDVQSLGTIRKYPIPPLEFLTPNHEQMKRLVEGFDRGMERLNLTNNMVVTVVCFMNLTSHRLNVQSPALSSGRVDYKFPWPTEIKPFYTDFFMVRKVNFSFCGSVGASIVSLPDNLKIIFYWHTPYDQNLFENSFGIGYHKGELSTAGNFLDRISCLPQIVPEGMNFTKQFAKDGTISLLFHGNHF